MRRSSKMPATFSLTTLTCTDPNCSATFEIFTRGDLLPVVPCQYCGGELMDISIYESISAAPDEDGPDLQVFVRHGPLRGAP